MKAHRYLSLALTGALLLAAGGCGAAAALGAVFRNAAGEAFVPVGATLAEVAEKKR